jgi:protein O-mannosyl-transferase
MEFRVSPQGKAETESAADSAPAGNGLAAGRGQVKFLADSRLTLPAPVLAATFLVYAGTLGFGFVYDDQGQIVRNLFIQSWHYVPRYFTSHVWSYLYPGNVANYYRPLFLIWLRANHALFGLEPAGWHLTSVLAHLVVTLEVYWLGVRLLEDRISAAVASALFGLHPIHVEAVAWVSGVTEPLVAALVLASFLAYLRAHGRGRKQWPWWAASLALYALAMLSKETALILPMLVFAYAWIWEREWGAASFRWEPLRRLEPFERLGASFLQAAPYLALTAAYLPIRIRALGGFSHVLTPVPIATSVYTWPSLVWFYAKKLVWPTGLSPFYDFPYVTGPGLREFLLPAAGVVLIAALLGFWARRREKPGNPSHWQGESRALAFASLWLCLPIVPLLNLSIFGSGDIAHDRYLYLPSIGASWIAAVCWKRLSAGGMVASRSLAFPLAIATAVAVLLGGLTVADTAYWSDNLSLYSRGTNLAPNNFRARLNLANAACNRGFYDAGLKLYAQVIERAPNFPLAFYDRGVTELELGRVAEADRDLTRAIELDGSDPTAFFSLGLVRYREGRLEDAASLLHRALELQPEAVGYHLALGRVLERSGELQGALEEFRAEYSAHPEMDEARQEILRLQILSKPENSREKSSGRQRE